MIRKTGIKVTVEMDRMGCLTVTPVSELYQQRIKDFLEGMGNYPDPSLFIQNDWETEHFLAERLSPSQVKDVNNGWPVTFLMDPHDYTTMIGWDCYTIVENGTMFKRYSKVERETARKEETERNIYR